MPKPKNINLNVTQKQVAQKRLDELSREAEQEHFHLRTPKPLRIAAKIEITEHLKDYTDNLLKLGRNERYIAYIRYRVELICKECNWQYLGQIKADQFERWRALKTLSGKSLNDYFTDFKTFCKWLCEHEKMEENPLRIVSQIDVRGKKANPRRALTFEELNKINCGS